MAFDIQSISAELLFFDDFNDGVADGWTEYVGPSSVGRGWSVVDGKYCADANDPCLSTVSDLTPTNCYIETKLRFTQEHFGFRVGIVFRYTDVQHYYSLELSNEYDSIIFNMYTPESPEYGLEPPPAFFNFETDFIQPNIDYTLRVEIRDNTFTGHFNGQEMFSWTNGTYASGKVGLRADTVHVVLFDNFTVGLYPPVGGIYIPVNKLSLLAPYLGLTMLLAVAVTTVVYVKKRKS